MEGTKGWLPKNPKPCAVLVLSAGEHKGLAGLAAHQPAGALTFALGACPWGTTLPLGHHLARPNAALAEAVGGGRWQTTLTGLLCVCVCVCVLQGVL